MSGLSKTPAVISSEIALKSSHAGWFLLVEGDFDQRFWETRVQPGHWRLVNCGGKPNALGVHALSLQGVPQPRQLTRCVVLVDKDFDELTGQWQPQSSRLVYTDHADLETTLFQLSDANGTDTLDRLLTESIDPVKAAAFERARGQSVRACLWHVATRYGRLRGLAALEGWSVDFGRLPILHERYLNHQTLDWDDEALLSDFAAAVQLDRQTLAHRLADPRLNVQFPDWGLVQGHDLMRLLAAFINSAALKRTGGVSASEASLQRDLCLIVHAHELQQTRMVMGVVAHAGGQALI
ncbi:hypothetical protein [Hydrogenophaga soli]